MDLNINTLIWLPLGLGLLGFVEPCSIGGHLVFLSTQENRTPYQRVAAVASFTLSRSLVTGIFGAIAAFLGESLISIQTSAWVVFGVIYFSLGVSFLFDRTGIAMRKIDLAPGAWKRIRNPAILGLVFGFNIPACAAPVLFGLLALAATTGTALNGFLMMFVFGLALSAPRIAVSISPKLADSLNRIGQWMKHRFWLMGPVTS